MAEFVKIFEINIGLTLFSIVFLKKILIYIDFGKGSGETKIDFDRGPGPSYILGFGSVPSRTDPSHLCYSSSTCPPSRSAPYPLVMNSYTTSMDTAGMEGIPTRQRGSEMKKNVRRGGERGKKNKRKNKNGGGK